MDVNLTSSIVNIAVVKQREKGKEEVIERDEENSVCLVIMWHMALVSWQFAGLRGSERVSTPQLQGSFKLFDVILTVHRR